MGDIIAELIVEANELLDVTRENMNALLVYSHNVVLPQELQAVRARVSRCVDVIEDLMLPAIPQAPNPAVAGQQQASSSVSGDPESSGSGSEA